MGTKIRRKVYDVICDWYQDNDIKFIPTYLLMNLAEKIDKELDEKRSV